MGTLQNSNYVPPSLLSSQTNGSGSTFKGRSNQPNPNSNSNSHSRKGKGESTGSGHRGSNSTAAIAAKHPAGGKGILKEPFNKLKDSHQNGVTQYGVSKSVVQPVSYSKSTARRSSSYQTAKSGKGNGFATGNHRGGGSLTGLVPDTRCNRKNWGPPKSPHGDSLPVQPVQPQADQTQLSTLDVIPPISSSVSSRSHKR